ncbi:hypothetical protein A0J61_06012 [Choanephora cucurbitarum]|uniref:Reverse transcriptase zinc-binding domain-containing protein n=1 Tax=Choanephora cucurbitarum TaxID=101091 RepID=A0A1C7NAF7_9FUNG|nr:hypothetical protein A0J61_06012 [Choanephora cucurbitarum]
MSNFHKIVFEDGQGGLIDEEGAELMEVDDVDVQVKNLVSMEDYLHKQANVEVEMSRAEEKDATETKPRKSKKGYTVYSEYDRINFILHMLIKAPKKITLVARKYNINERTEQRWWSQYKNDPNSFFVPKTRGDRKKLSEEHSDFLIDLTLPASLFLDSTSGSLPLVIRRPGTYARHPYLLLRLFREVVAEVSIHFLPIVNTWIHSHPSASSYQPTSDALRDQVTTNHLWNNFTSKAYRLHNYTAATDRRAQIPFSVRDSSLCSLCRQEETHNHFLAECPIRWSIWVETLVAYFPHHYFISTKVVDILNLRAIPPPLATSTNALLTVIFTTHWVIWVGHWRLHFDAAPMVPEALLNRAISLIARSAITTTHNLHTPHLFLSLSS